MDTQAQLKKLIKSRGVPLSIIARRGNLKYELIRRSISGKRRMTLDEFMSICDVLGITLEDFDMGG